MFACFTPVALPSKSFEFIKDASRRTCIVSLLNAHRRPFRLCLTSGEHPNGVVGRSADGDIWFGDELDHVCLNEASVKDCCSYQGSPHTFELDQAAERAAGLPALAFRYDSSLLSGMQSEVSRGGVATTLFGIDEIECYEIK